MDKNKKIRTRFAPSPTGELHIGGARTALFAYLFAKSKNGDFLLRIEDTDRERFVEGAIDRIVESLNWLGIKADNQNPMVQSERIETYKKHAFDLVKSGKAYICTCHKDRLKKLRDEQMKNKVPTGYDGKCREIINKVENIEDLEKELSKGAVVRLKMPQEGKIIVNDLVRSRVEFDSSLLDDTIILKSDGFPTYHLASVVDDTEMKISHVIRAEEWLSSTPKHLVLYQAFGWKAPEFAHLPMILGPDKKKLSKRHGATSVLEYKKLGYLSEAITNFISLLGWNPKDEREIFSLAELEEGFKLENVNKSSAVFDLEKLNYINAEKLKELDADKLRKLLDDDYKLTDLSDGEIEIAKRGGYKTLKEAADYILKLRKEPQFNKDLLVFKKSDQDKTKKGLEGALKALEGIENNDWSEENIQKALSCVVEENDLSNGDVFWPVRVALSGEEKSPSPVELALALGKEKSIMRIKAAF